MTLQRTRKHHKKQNIYKIKQYGKETIQKRKNSTPRKEAKDNKKQPIEKTKPTKTAKDTVKVKLKKPPENISEQP